MTQGGNEVGGHQRFRGWAGRASPWGVEGQGSTVAFGGQVLDDVTAGLRDFLDTELWGSRRRPAVLGCSPWLTDREVIDELLRFSDSCIVINKPGLSASLPSEVRRLHRDGPGFALDALHEFETLARLDDGRPLVVGPSTTLNNGVLGSVRVAGEGPRQARQTLPLVHLKLLVLGLLIDTDEHPEGFAVDYRTFIPRRVWLGSANLTWNSRRSLELGVWCQDQRLADQARDFLVELLAYSEPIGTDSTAPAPEFHEVEFDDVAMREAAAALFGSDVDDEDDGYGRSDV